MNILLGVTGGIAAYKACDVTNGLRALGYDVKVIMTKNAVNYPMLKQRGLNLSRTTSIRVGG